MIERRKIAAILAADVVGFSRMASADEDRTLARLRVLRADVIDPIIASQNGRVFKRTGDGALVEFRSVVEALRCAISVQNAMAERNVGTPEDQRIVFRIGVHLGDVVEESDGDLMGDGVNIAARLEGIAKPGAICLSEDAFRQVKGRLDLAVTDLGPTALKNIAEPVRAYSVEVGVAAVAKPAPATPPKPHMVATTLAVAVVLILVVVAGGAWLLLGGNRAAHIASNAPAARLSIVVLPFANLSNDPSQDYFADGITENLTTDLSRIHNSFIIARNTAFTFKGKPIDVKEIGKELGVRYVLEGSVQRDQNHVRVNAQLIDVETGAHLWADRFEEEITDLFKLQDQVVGRLANALGLELVLAEAAKAARLSNPDAIDLTMRGLAILRKSPVPKDKNIEAQSLLGQALKLDPNDADALAGGSYASMLEYSYWRTPDTDYNAEVLGQADKAISLARDAMWAYYAKSNYLFYLRRFNEALAAADAGVAVNPNFAPLYGARANANNALLRFDAAQSDVQVAIRLSPRDPYIGYWHFQSCLSQIGFGRFDVASDECLKATESGFRTQYTWAGLAAADAQNGKLEQAKSAVTELLRLNPKLTVKWFVNVWDFPAYIDGLRKAGLPEE